MHQDKLVLARNHSNYLLNVFMTSKCAKEKKRLREEIHDTWDTIRLLKLEDKIRSIP